NDRRKIELVNALLLSMPGTPIMYYGDELGMGDNIYLGDRDGVRTPMQWTPDRNGGFSRADPAQLYLPPIMDAVYGYHAVNVEAQERSLSSLLNWMKRLIAVRQSLAVFGRGGLTFLYPANRAVIAYLRQHEKVTVLRVATLSRSAQPVELELPAFADRIPVELTPPDEAQKPTTQLMPELVTLVETGGLRSAVEGRNLRLLEREVLPAYLRARRWFAQKSERSIHIEVEQNFCFTLGGREWCWMIAEASSKETICYSLPVVEDWQTTAVSPASLAKIRRSYKEGLLQD